MALGGRLTQLNNLMHRFLGVPLDHNDEPDNVFRLLRQHIGASSPRDILRLTREDLDNFELIDAIGDEKELTFVQKLRILDLGRWASSRNGTVDWANDNPDDFEQWGWVDDNVYQPPQGHGSRQRHPSEYHVPPQDWSKDHSELDMSPECSPDEAAKFYSLLGACQWMITLCRFDIAHSIMSLSRFRNLPRVGHLNRLKKICGYHHPRPHPRCHPLTRREVRHTHDAEMSFCAV